MRVVLIELGTYSIKFLQGVIERKNIRYSDFHEEIVRETLPRQNDSSKKNKRGAQEELNFLETVQFKLIEDYLQKYPLIEKVIINLPSYYSTLRLIRLPIRNKKKIEQMIPFQLEEELPYPLSEAHLAMYPIISSTESYTISLSTPLEQFDSFFERTQKLARPPVAIIGQESIYQTFVKKYDLDGAMAIINLGHSESQCFLFHNKYLVGVETSFVCGQVIDEVIAETYQISVEEEILFKHENAFFLTDDQAQNVDKDQKDFSLLMKKIFSNFIDDFKRWNIGYQLKTGQGLKKILITGGISNIKNIDHFLTQNLGVQVSHFKYLQQTSLADLAIPTSSLRSLTACYGLSYYLTTKEGLINFRRGNYATHSESELPLSSISFIGIRTMMACLILFIVLAFENTHLAQSDKEITRKMSNKLKDPVFALTPSQRRKLTRDPKQLLSFLKKKNQEVEKQASVFKEIIQINGIRPLGDMGRIIDDSHDVELVSFKKENKRVEAIFKAKNNSILKSLEKTLMGQSYHNLKTVLEKEKKMLKLTFNTE